MTRVWRRLDAVPANVQAILIAVIVATLVVSAVQRTGLLERLELDAFDALIRSIPDRGPNERLLIVSVSEADTARLGYPLSDEVLARAIAELRRHGPRVVAVDLYRNIAYPPGADQLAEQFRARNVVGIRFIGSDPLNGQVPAPPALPSEQVGFSDLVIDPDGVLRRALLYVDGEPGYFSFALRSVLAGYPGARNEFGVADEALLFGEQPIPRLRHFAGGYADVDNGGYQTLLRFSSRRQPAEVIPLSALLDGHVRRETIESRVVLIGETDASLADQFYTPYSAGLTDTDFAMSAVFVHAQIISQLLDVINGTPAQFRYFSRLGELGWLVLWAALAALMSSSIRNPLGSLLLILAPPVAIAVIGWLALRGLLWPPLIAPALAAVLGSLIAIAAGYFLRGAQDNVTGLPGRSAFLNRIQAALRQSTSDHPVAVAFFDIDRFQVINKALGHDAGDELLVRMANRLRKWTAHERDLARVGGDEFALLFRDRDAASVERRVGEIRHGLAEPLVLGNHTLSVTASVGVVFVNKHSSQHPDAVLRDAHTAMYRAKARKEVQLEVFSPDMADQALARLGLESDLLDAVRNKEFFLNYQPIVDLQTGSVLGFEALLRWRSPKHGQVSPGEFIPILEETGMIVPVGQWVLESACRQASKWRSALPELDLKMSVNLSGRQINEAGLESVVRQTLSASGLAPHALQLEFTESMIMRDVESTNLLMSALRSLGVSLAIDDFGTGYSSLAYLHRFPLNTLKIDRAFVENLTEYGEDHQITHTIIALGQRLNMTLVAEGIETEEQAEALREAGCHGAQGFLYSAALSVEQVEEWLAARPNLLH
ncbi:MAG: EAL domain-containing protein [Wenzhouxiangella sp.]|jgi:diguanylate cyclase (GGDEF)-like protein|nr:EAL domain-containing protein [Wenzhouxiangella sp.]